MAINLQKGQRISLGLSQVAVGLGWDPAANSGHEFDLDASTFLLNGNGKLPSDDYFVFYNNKLSPDGAVQGADDDRSGGNSAGGDDETVLVDLSRVNAAIQDIMFVVTIHDAKARKQNFGQVRNSYIRIYNSVSNEEIAKYELDEDFSIEDSVEFGRLYRRGDEWRFEAIGKGYQGGLDFFVNKFQ